MVRLLLSYGADANAKTYSGETSANIAGMLDFKTIKELLDDFCEDNSFVTEQEAIDDNVALKRTPWKFFGNASCVGKQAARSASFGFRIGKFRKLRSEQRNETKKRKKAKEKKAILHGCVE